MVCNLLHNAAKFSPVRGHVDVGLEVEDGSVRLTVQDDGIGLDPGQEREIFELFSQADRSLARSEGGLGVGLTMVANLVRMHGGEVTAESPGRDLGTTVTVTLPRMDAEVEAGEDRPSRRRWPAEPEIVERPRRVLVVEDGVDAAEALRDLLRLWGHEAWIAHDGSEGLELYEAHRPDVVLLDIGLPEMDGYEVASKIREASPDDGVLLVALTGYGQEKDVRRALDSGFDHHLLKPTDPASLRELLARPDGGEPPDSAAAE